MEEKVFNKMKEYGWNLDNFKQVSDYHYNFLSDSFECLKEPKNWEQGMSLIDKNEFFDMTAFVCDFMRAVNDITKENELSNFDDIVEYLFDNCDNEELEKIATWCLKTVKISRKLIKEEEENE